jgi:ketosteroid isomerase-like protein
MSIQIAIDAPQTPARAASVKSMQLSMAGKGDEWLDLFAEDALVQDPYGQSPMDPSGEGHRGKDAIRKFCAAHIRPGAIGFAIRQTLTSGKACVNVGTITVKHPDGSVQWSEVVNVYEVDDAGKITLLRSYWDFEAASKTNF